MEILIDNHTFSFMKMQLKMSSEKWRPYCLGLNVLIHIIPMQWPRQSNLQEPIKHNQVQNYFLRFNLFFVFSSKAFIMPLLCSRSKWSIKPLCDRCSDFRQNRQSLNTVDLMKSNNWNSVGIKTSDMSLMVEYAHSLICIDMFYRDIRSSKFIGTLLSFNNRISVSKMIKMRNYFIKHLVHNIKTFSFDVATQFCFFREAS